MTDERLKIDRFNLDNELLENPSLVQEVCDECAEAIALRDAKKEALDTVDAELDAEIREELSKNSKVTENIVKVAIQVHPDHKRAFEEYNNAKLIAAKAASLERAVSTRSDALKELSKLYAAGYFAIDSTKRLPATQELKYNKQREQLADRRLKR
jgi:hypothetical protein